MKTIKKLEQILRSMDQDACVYDVYQVMDVITYFERRLAEGILIPYNF